MDQKVRTRIAPSPTGYVHVGTLRTALFNYFYAKQNNGTFFIRLEDTDRTRLVEGSAENLINVFKDLKINFDEGLDLDEKGNIIQKGEFGPYIQSERLHLYQEAIKQLLEKGIAYHCFCTKERLDEMRKEQQALKLTPKYDRKCANLSREEVEQRIQNGEKYVIRLRIPEGETTFEDEIRGTVKFSNDQLDDQVLLKADGFPTYHLAVVVDDNAMKTSHIIRGEEWLSSTPKHIILYNALNYNLPKFAHLPLLLNPDKSKLSKRQGDVSVEDFLKKGYLPETLINFIGTLGFNPRSDQEIYSLQELINEFDLKKVNKAGAVLNHEKLNWMNGQYINSLEHEKLRDIIENFHNHQLTETEFKLVIIEKSRIDNINDFSKIWENPYNIVQDANLLVWKKAEAKDSLKELQDIQKYIESSDFTDINEIEQNIKNWIKNQGKNNGDVLWPLRVALSGQEKSPSPFELLWAFGKEKSLEKINKSIDKLEDLV